MNINLETNKSQKQQEPKVVCAKSSNRTVDKGDGESDEDDASDITLKDSQINEKISSVVVSVKKYVEHSEMDELTVMLLLLLLCKHFLINSLILLDTVPENDWH